MMEMPWEDFLGDFLVRQHGGLISSAGMISGSAIADRARRSGCGNTARRMDWAAT